MSHDYVEIEHQVIRDGFNELIQQFIQMKYYIGVKRLPLKRKKKLNNLLKNQYLKKRLK
jgi:hypothetical protein